MNDEAAAKFAENLRGPVIGRGHPDCEETRKLYNGMIDKHPRVIARCADVADVAAANFIRANMPIGTDCAHPVLSVLDAFDVAAFVDSRPRPHRPGNERDFPDRALEPADATHPPFLGPFPPSQDNAQSLRRNSAAPGD